VKRTPEAFSEVNGEPRTEAGCGGEPSGPPEHRARGTGFRQIHPLGWTPARTGPLARQRAVGFGTRVGALAGIRARIPGNPRGTGSIEANLGRKDGRSAGTSFTLRPGRHPGEGVRRRSEPPRGGTGRTCMRRSPRRSAVPRWFYGKRGGSPSPEPHRGLGPSGSRRREATDHLGDRHTRTRGERGGADDDGRRAKGRGDAVTAADEGGPSGGVKRVAGNARLRTGFRIGPRSNGKRGEPSVRQRDATSPHHPRGESRQGGAKPRRRNATGRLAPTGRRASGPWSGRADARRQGGKEVDEPQERKG